MKEVKDSLLWWAETKTERSLDALGVMPRVLLGMWLGERLALANDAHFRL